jgi:catechol 2,3-dioxygenase
MAILVSKVGHVVLKVSSLDTALSFYSGVLGLTEVARRDFGEGPMVFLSTGNSHHDIALVEAGGGPGGSGSLGLHHVALKVGDSVANLAEVKRDLDANGVPVHMVLDHRVSQGIYVSDPDGNLLELYVDADPGIWHNDPALVANSDPFTLES